MWGGVECTVNRVGNRYMDQLDWSAHATRTGDLTLFAELGLKAIRYPVLWERIAPRGVAFADWSWSDERLALLKELSLPPIVGLVHHACRRLWASSIMAAALHQLSLTTKVLYLASLNMRAQLLPAIRGSIDIAR
jgi:hypothetical protein